MLCVTVLLTFPLSGCATPADEPSPIGSDAPVLVPGGPGSPGRTARPGERLTPSAQEPVAADVRFAEGMIPHHRQALEMAALVRERTTTAPIRTMAAQITLTQQPEIDIMAAWLRSLGRPAPDPHDHASPVNGMATLAELNELRAARGPAFDRLFLKLMIRHHEGALAMADTAIRQGRDPRMVRLARDVYSGQSVEIARMRKVEGTLR